MNNNFTRQLWLSAIVVLALFASAKRADAQQCDIAVNPMQLNLEIILDPINGTGSLTASTVSGNVTSGNCAPVAARKYRFYSDQAKTTPFPDSDFDTLPGNIVIQTVNFNCDDVGNGYDIWVAINDGSIPFNKNSESEAVSINVGIVDNTPPHINAPSDITVFADANCEKSNIPGINMTLVPKIVLNPALAPGTYTDNCTSFLQIGYLIDFGNNGTIEDTVTGSNNVGLETFPIGLTRVVYEVLDDQANKAQDVFFVTVVDTTPPSISCPPNRSAGTAVNTCDTTVFNIQPLAILENCTPVSDTSWMVTGATTASGAKDASGTVFNAGVSTVTYTVTDMNMGTGTCSFTVTVNDNAAPTFNNCPAADTVAVIADPPAGPDSCAYRVAGGVLDVTAIDNCPGLLPMENNVNAGVSLNNEVFTIGYHNIIWTAEDAQGNTSVCAFVLEVADTTTPVVNFNRQYNVNVTPGDCSSVVTIDQPDVNDPAGVSDCGLPVVLTRGVPVVNGVPDPNFLNGSPAYNPNVPGQMISVQFPVGVTVIPYSWTDSDNNVQAGSITVTVIENEAPVAICRTDTILVNLEPNSGATTLAAGTVNDGSTDNCPPVSLSLSQSNFTCADIGVRNVNLIVSDKAGNKDTCTATVRVRDVSNPVMLCPASLTVNANTSCFATVPGLGMVAEPNLADLGPGEFFDNALACGNFVRQYSLSGAETKPYPAPGLSDIGGLATETFVLGVTTVGIRVFDPSGNPNTCFFNVTVQDKTGPQYAGGQPASSTINANANLGGCIAQVNWAPPTFTDQCSPGVTVMSSHNPGAFFPFGQTVVMYTATDASGNTTIHTFTVNVVDIQPPVAVCKNITASLGANGQVTVPVQNIDGGSTDNCFFNYTIQNYVFNCSDLGPNTVTMTIQDGSNNSASCNAVITVEDNIPPTANCAMMPPVLLAANGMAMVNAAQFNNNSTDNCGAAALSYEISVNGSAFGSSFTFDCGDVGVIQNVTLRVIDGSGNSAGCQTSIVVQDLLAPSFTAPQDITVECGNTTPDVTGEPFMLTDNCSSTLDTFYSDQISSQSPDPSCADKTIIRTWRVTDAGGNSSTATQIIVVSDNTLPVFSMKPTIVTQTDISNQCDGPFSAKVTADSVGDNCTDFVEITVSYAVDYPTGSGFTDIPQTVGNMVPNNRFPIGTTQIIWRAEDGCGNIATFTQNIVVNDTQAPSFQAPFNSRCGQTINLNNTPGECSSLFVWNRPTNFFAGVGQVDIFECPLTDLNPAGRVTETISDPTVQAFINTVLPFTWNVSNTQVTANFPIGSTTVTYVASDAEGNSSTCAFTVVVTDNQKPTINCPANQVLPSTCPDALVPNYLNNAQITDNCQTDLTLSQMPMPGATLGSIFGGMPMAGDTFSVTIQAGDSNPANTVTCTFLVTLEDGQAPIPVINFLPPIVGFCGEDTIYAPLAIDPCSPNDSIWGTPSIPGMSLNTDPPSYLIAAGSYIVTWSYTDGINTTTQQQLITLLADVFPPQAICKPAFPVNLDPSGFAVINLSQIDNGSNDPNACGPITRTLSQSSFTCVDLGQNIITLTVTDDGGNTATCTTTVTVNDVTPPVLPPIPANDTIEACDTIPPPANLNSADACDSDIDIALVEISTQDTFGVDKYNYTITRTWTLTDDSGNSSVGTQTITVQDMEAPVFDAAAPDTVVVVSDATRFTCDDTVSINIAPFVTDCATGLDLAISNNLNPAQGGNFSGILGAGTHSIVFTATDITGNASQKTVTIVVTDGTTPTAACINGISVALNPSGIVNVNAVQVNANSFDNCTPANALTFTIERLDDSLSNPGPGVTFTCADADGTTQHPLELTVFDAAGNSSSCLTYVIVQDNVDPAITSCPPSKTLNCEEDTSPQIHGQAMADDNCVNNLSITFQDTLLPGVGNACALLQRTWIAADLANNTASCVQNFNIIDTIVPVFDVLPANDTIACSDTIPALPVVTASDNCTDSVMVTLQVDTVGVTSGVCGQYNYSIRRTWTAADDCGNQATHSQLVVVQDVEPPVFAGMPDTITFFTDDFPGVNACVLPVDLDAADYLEDCADISELLVTNNSPFGDSSFNAGGMIPVGTYKFMFTATDPCGNVGADSVVVNIVDNSTPSMVCLDQVDITLGSNGSASLDADDLNLGSTDNCGIDTLLLSQTVFDCSDLGLNMVELTAVDAAGNTNTCTVDVDVKPGTVNVFNLTVSSTPETTLGASNGTATATATGGSGNFSYLWDNSDTTAMITGLPAGVYSVTVTDENTGCVKSDSVTVDAGVKLTIIVGELGGAWGEVLSVPVTVENFIDIVGFTFTIDVVDPSVGTLLGVSNVNPSIAADLNANVVGNKLGVFWADPLVQTLNLPNGTLLFNVDVMLNTAPLGSISPVDVTGDPLSIEFQQDSMGNIIVVPMVDIDNGFVEITDTIGSNDLTIAGDIKTWMNPENPASMEVPVKNVQVNLSGSQIAQVTVDSVYAFQVPMMSNTVVRLNKQTVGNTGISSADLLRIVNHIFGDTLPSPYMWIAGDVNNDKKVSLADYLLIQRVVLGVDSILLQGPSWRFVPKAHIFPPNNTLPNGPLSAPYPDSIAHTPVDMDYLDDDFVAVRMGDVNGNTPVNLKGDDVASDRYGSSDALNLRVRDQALRAGNILELPVRADRFAQRQAYQLTMTFDRGVLAFESAEPGELPGLTVDNFGLAHLSDGHLTTNWVNRTPVDMPEDQVLFTLRFRVLNDADALSAVLEAGSAVTRAESYTTTGETTPVNLLFTPAQPGVQPAFVLFQNQPNPFDGSTRIRFQLPEAGNTTLRVFNSQGQLVKTIDAWFGAGVNEVRLMESELGDAGVYWYEVESGRHLARKKMVLVK